MKKSESIVEITKALASFQAEVKQPKKSKDNPFHKSKYVPLEDVVEAIVQTAQKHHLSFTQWALNAEDGRVGVATMVNHSKSGEWMEFPALFLDLEKKTAQAAGSAITYARRYALTAIFGITADEDDDANEASGTTVQKTSAKQTSKSSEPSIDEVKKAYALAFNKGEDGFDEFFNQQSAKYSAGQILFYLNKKIQSEKGK